MKLQFLLSLDLLLLPAKLLLSAGENPGLCANFSWVSSNEKPFYNFLKASEHIQSGCSRKFGYHLYICGF